MKKLCHAWEWFVGIEKVEDLANMQAFILGYAFDVGFGTGDVELVAHDGRDGLARLVLDEGLLEKSGEELEENGLVGFPVDVTVFGKAGEQGLKLLLHIADGGDPLPVLHKNHDGMETVETHLFLGTVVGDGVGLGVVRFGLAGGRGGGGRGFYRLGTRAGWRWDDNRFVGEDEGLDGVSNCSVVVIDVDGHGAWTDWMVSVMTPRFVPMVILGFCSRMRRMTSLSRAISASFSDNCWACEAMRMSRASISETAFSNKDCSDSLS